MDEFNNAHIHPQISICSDSNGEETYKNDASFEDNRKICLVGNLANNPAIRSMAELFGVPVVISETGQEYAEDNSCSTFFVLENFEGNVFNNLFKKRRSILGPPALEQLAKNENPELPDNTRPLFNISMRGVVVCFTGFRNKDDLTKLVPFIHHMGGSIRKDMTARVTHLIANNCVGDKYQYAATFKVPVMNCQWVLDSWENRNDINFCASVEPFVAKYKLKPFHNAKVCFLGFQEDEEKHMTEILLQNGGVVTNLEDPNCTHVVMEHSEVFTLEAASAPLSPKVTNSIKKILSLSTVATPLSQNNNEPVPLNNDHLDNLNNESSNNTTLFESSFDASFNRKRKFVSPEQPTLSVKRKKEKSYSERKKKVSDFFKTPVNYFSQRRRTIDATGLRQNVSSSSGMFNVETLDNLSICSDRDATPRKSHKCKTKSLFTRTFSSSKFKNKKRNGSVRLNSSRLSFNESVDLDYTFNGEQLNTSCFPDISLNPFTVPASTSELGSEISRPTRGTSALAVVDESTVSERPDVPARVYVVKAEWFWISVQKQISLEEKEFLFDNYIQEILTPNARRDSHVATPSSASRRKRKRIQDTIHTLVQQSPTVCKRRSSVSDAGLLSVSGSFLDCTASPNEKGILDTAEPILETPRKGLTARHQVFLELLQTEINYVDILHTIMTMFKKHLEEMPEEEALLNNTELNLIFGKIPPIYDVHIKMLDEFKYYAAHWVEDKVTIGDIIIKFSTELLKAYPPFINYFEEMKEVLTQCDQNKPRFHAFLKACQTRYECGRQSLQELMIRPVQRLGSISLLISDILKNTPKSNPDHAALNQALAALKEVMTHINEDKKKTEGQVTIFNIFNEIDYCPPDIVSSHRSYITKCEVVQISSSEGLANKGANLVLYLFSDQLEVCKKKSKVFNSAKSPSSTAVSSFQLNKPATKPYKHVKLLPLNTIKKVIDIKETEDCQKVFSLVYRSNDELKERLFSFAMADEDADKVSFLKTLTRQMATNSCTPDPDKFMACLEAQQLDIDTSDLSNGTLSKAFKFASKTRLKVERAFSFNKTPSKLKRAVSSMMSPFGSSTNLTPSSQLAQMKLASYSNINELGNAGNSQESLPPAPLSVQPTRKMKASSLGVNALKRL